MKIIIFIFCFFSFFSQASRLIDILKTPDHSLALEKKLKKDIGSLFPSFNKPNDFIKAFEDKDFEKALYLWLSTIKNTSFSKSSTGSALYSYILFKNGFENTSLKNLLENSKPNEIDSIVKNLWKTDIDKNHSVWDHFLFPIDKKWSAFFDEKIIFKIGSKYPFQIEKDQEYIKLLLGLPLSAEVDTFSLEWSFVLALIKQGDMLSATKILAWLIDKTKNQNKKDMIHLAIARLLANIGETKASLHYYTKLSNASYFWLLAQEEKTWIFLNEENYTKAYSTASIFEYPQFKKEISSHMFFVLAFSQLKNCDYKGVARSLSDFKFIFSKRKIELEKDLNSNSYKNLINKLSTFYNLKKSYYEIGGSDLFYRLRKDNFLKNHISLYNYIKLRRSDRKTKFKSLDKQESQIVAQLEEKIERRIEMLLQKEITKIKFVLKNFHIIETEALYRIYGFHPFLSVKGVESKKSIWKNINFYKSNDYLYFPFDSDEIWLDELFNYTSESLKNCPKGSYIL